MQGKTLLLGAFLWAGSIGAAFFAGSHFAGTDGGASEKLSREPESAREDLRPLANVSGWSESFALENTANEPLTALSPVQLLKRSLNEEDPLARMKNLLSALENLSPENVEAFAAQMATVSGRENGQLLTYFIHEWARFDPVGAIGFAQEQSNGRQSIWLTSTAMRSWGKEDPEAALSYLETTELATDDSFLLPGLISGWADNDPIGAAQYALSIEDNQIRRRSTWGVAREMVGQDVEQIKNTLNSLPDADQQSALLTAITSQLSRDDPSSSLSLLQEMDPGLTNTRAVGELIEGWVDHDPVAASEFVLQLPEGEERSAGLASLIDRWSRQDPVQAGEWLNQFPPSAELDQPVVNYVNRVQRNDPEGALSWASSITDEATREELMVEVATRWMVRDETNATAYLTDPQVPDTVRESVFSRFEQEAGE